MVTMLSCAWVFEWYAKIWDGCENLEDDECSGRPTAVRMPDMVETVWESISTDHRMTLQMMEKKLKISKETICKILTKNLGKWKICARFVPYCLTNEQKALRLEACQEFTQSADDDCSFLD
jgi:hypothetical protein